MGKRVKAEVPITEIWEPLVKEQSERALKILNETFFTEDIQDVSLAVCRETGTLAGHIEIRGRWELFSHTAPKGEVMFILGEN